MVENYVHKNLPFGWADIAVVNAVISVSTNGKKIQQKKYSEQGRYAVVDQGQEHIGGYTNDDSMLVDCELPVIVFGDHTKVIKYVNQPFAAGADGIKVLQPHKFIVPKYLEYSLRFCSSSMISKGYARHYQHLAMSRIPLPPHNKQLRIVAKIEELFSELDKGIESLKTAREQLKVYRQALLKHAFEGKLTASWREENKDVGLVGAKQGSSASPTFNLRGKQGKGQNQGEAGEAFASPLQENAPTKRRKDLPPLTAEELAELPELPDGRPMFFDMNDYRFIDNSSGCYNDYFLVRGDLVFTRYNGSRHYVGVCARYNSDEMRLFPDKLIQTRVDCSQVDTSYLERVLLERIRAEKHTTVKVGKSLKGKAGRPKKVESARIALGRLLNGEAE